MSQIENDANLITQIGTARLARILSAAGEDVSMARVSNWKRRGIPSKVKVDHPHLLMPEIASKRRQKKSTAGGK